LALTGRGRAAQSDGWRAAFDRAGSEEINVTWATIGRLPRVLGIEPKSRGERSPALEGPVGEAHRSHRAGWLRAAVLGADDGIVATASLMIGVAASSASSGAILVAGLAGLAAGALSMAAGEYVSVSSQRDAEDADVAIEIEEHQRSPERELAELADLYVARGLDPHLAGLVARELTEHGALDAHLRDEFGFTPHGRARPVQAAVVSAVSFAVGATPPIVGMVLAPQALRIPVIALVALALLGSLGVAGAHAGGASRTRGALRVCIGGGMAMAITALIGLAVGGVTG
jgi:VIT1/CCC1 family predicted Fe2+/Mn2+ transporter